MNKMVAIATATAVPTLAPALAGELPPAPTLAAPADDHDLVELAEQMIKAWAESDRLCDIVEEMRFANRFSGFPEELRILPTDAYLGRTPWEPKDEFWHRPCDINKWRCIEVWERDEGATVEGLVMTIRCVPPSEKLKARALEIVGAYDQWDAAHQPPRGYKAAERASEKANRKAVSLFKRLVRTKARSLNGLVAKARVAEKLYFEDEELSKSIVIDVLALVTT